MTFDPHLQPGEQISNRQLIDLFKCSSQGGMRRSHATESLVLIADHTQSLYENRWIDGRFHFSGIGKKGDQQLEFSQNKTLAKSTDHPVSVFLFEVFETGRYIYAGRVALDEAPYTAIHPDIEGNCRKVWVFPLRLAEGIKSPQIAEELVRGSRKRSERLARKLSDKELVKRARNIRSRAGSRRAVTDLYDKNIYVAELALRKANGICQLCDQPAPFRDRYGRPFLETHHITWISEGGDDAIDNTVALCPNCHAKMHTLNLKSDRRRLKKKAARNVYQHTLFGEVIFC